MTYIHFGAGKAAPLENVVNIPQKHIIHKAIEWQRMLADGAAGSLSEIAKREGLTRARVTQVMNLLKLPDEVKTFLAGLDDNMEIRKHSERKLRHQHNPQGT